MSCSGTERVVSLLKTLVAFDTVSEHSDYQCAAFVESQLSQSGARTGIISEEVGGVQKCSVYGVFGPMNERGLVVCGHLDTVPFEGQEGWQSPPLGLSRRGDRLHGRGTADMKGFIAQCLAAAPLLKRESLRRPIIFLFTCDEELGGAGSRRLCPRLENLLPCKLPLEGWIGEPTAYRVLSAQKGYITFNVVVRGVGGHSSTPDNGCNAITAAAIVVEAMARLDRAWATGVGSVKDPAFQGSPTSRLNVARICGGSALNMIPESCELAVSIRVVPTDNTGALLQQVRDEMHSALQRAYASVPVTPSLQVSTPVITPGMASSGNASIERLLKKQLGQAAREGAPFATDAGSLAEIGCECAVCGPGQLEQAHQANEFIGIQPLLSGVDLIVNVCQAWSGL